MRVATKPLWRTQEAMSSYTYMVLMWQKVQVYYSYIHRLVTELTPVQQHLKFCSTIAMAPCVR